jgi:hypothetical protein
MGFNPHNSNFPLQSAFPLLMAGGVEWMTHSVDESAESLSTGELDLPGPATRIISPSGRDVPFARKAQDVHLLATETGVYRVVSPSGETNVAVNTPLLPAQRMTLTPPETARIESEPFQRPGGDLWRWLVLLGMAALWLEWWLYYSGRENRRAMEMRAAPVDVELQNTELELDRAAEESEDRKPNFVRLGG